MAKINPVKLRQDAEKEERANRPDRAVPIYRQIVEDNPRDWNTINKIGDLLVKQGRNQEASTEFAKVADFYAKDGFLLKAIAIWKKINKLEPTALDPYLNLADLYSKQGLMMEAKGQYQVVVDEYLKRGKMRDAGDVLKKMADIDPADLKIRSRLADLYTREGNAPKAIEEHIAIAEELNKKGHLAEALQVLEKGLKIDGRSVRLRTELARVHLIQKNYEKAAMMLEEAVQLAPADTQILARLGESYIGAKKLEEAEAIFKRLLELDSKDDDSRVQIGRVYLLQGQFDRSYDELAPLVDRALERREGDKAASLLQGIVQKNPAHVKSLLKLADVYRILQKDSAVSATYSQLVEAYMQQNMLEPAASVLETLVSREPSNGQHRTKLEFVRSKLAGPVSAPAPPPPARVAPEVVDEEFDLSSPMPESPAPVPTGQSRAAPAAAPAVPRPPAARPAAAGTPQAPHIELSGPLSDEDKEFIEEHLAEGKVFRKYGLVDKAADQFESVVARFPDNVESRQELREVYREKGQLLRAAEQSLALAEIFRLRGDAGAAEGHRADAARFAPESVFAAPASPPQPTEEEEISFPTEEDLDLATDEEEIPVQMDEAEEARQPPESADQAEFIDDATVAPPSSNGFASDDDFGGDGEFEVEEDDALPASTPPDADAPAADEGFDVGFGDAGTGFEEEELPPLATGGGEEPSFPDSPSFGEGSEIPAFPDEAPSFGEESPFDHVPGFGEAAAQAAPAPVDDALDGFGDSFASSAAPPIEDEPTLEVPPLAAAPPRPATPRAAVPAELQRVLDEVDSYVALGFVDDARDALSELQVRFPGHFAIAHKIEELGFSSAEEPVAPDLAPPASWDDFAVGSGGGGPVDSAPNGAGALDDLEASDRGPGAPEEDPFGDLSLGGSDNAEASEEQSAQERQDAFADDLLGDSEPPGGWDAASVEPPEPEPHPPAESRPEELEATMGQSTFAEGGGIDLGAALGDLFGAQSAVEETPAEAESTGLDAGLADIFKEFKKGVDKQLGKEDYDTRYNLGIAYKEMGLVDEAIAEFQLAAKDPGRILECSSMLGICFMDKGMPKLAVKWFEKGLAAPDRSEDEYAALRYDLATAHEASGEVDKALSLFTDLYGQDANFRDVAAKVRELRAPRS